MWELPYKCPVYPQVTPSVMNIAASVLPNSECQSGQYNPTVPYQTDKSFFRHLGFYDHVFKRELNVPTGIGRQEPTCSSFKAPSHWASSLWAADFGSRLPRSHSSMAYDSILCQGLLILPIFLNMLLKAFFKVLSSALQNISGRSWRISSVQGWQQLPSGSEYGFRAITICCNDFEYSSPVSVLVAVSADGWKPWKSLSATDWFTM